MPDAISQMQVVYNAEEDRLLFRVNTTTSQQFRFWLTRRFTILFLKVLREHIENDPDVSTQATPEAKEAIKNFKQEQAIQSANFKDKFVEQAEELPLGDEIPIAFKLTYAVKESVLSIGVHPKEGKGITININQDINASLTQLLLGAGRKGEWGLDAALPFVAGVSTENKVIN